MPKTWRIVNEINMKIHFHFLNISPFLNNSRGRYLLHWIERDEIKFLKKKTKKKQNRNNKRNVRENILHILPAHTRKRRECSIYKKKLKNKSESHHEICMTMMMFSQRTAQHTLQKVSSPPVASFSTLSSLKDRGSYRCENAHIHAQTQWKKKGNP